MNRSTAIPSVFAGAAWAALFVLGCAGTERREPQDEPGIRVSKGLWDDESGDRRGKTADSLWGPLSQALRRHSNLRVVEGGSRPADPQSASNPERGDPGSMGRRAGPGVGGMRHGPGGRPAAPGPSGIRSEGGGAAPADEFFLAGTLERWDLRDSSDATAKDSIRLSVRLVARSNGRAAWAQVVGCSSLSALQRTGEGPRRPGCVDGLMDSVAAGLSEIAHRLGGPN